MVNDNYPIPDSDLKIPQHIGIIMDGNGRWAKKRGLLRFNGHKQGAKTFTDICRFCNTIGVKFLTVYAFSTENWKRPQREINAIMNLLREYLNDAENNKEENIRTRFIGDVASLDQDIVEGMRKCEITSRDFTGMTLNIAVNYGGRDEILHAVHQVISDVQDKKIKDADLTEDVFSKYMYTQDQPDVDLIIRPSGEQRLSNFLIWQSAYAEFVYRNVLWPDFTPNDLLDCICEYNNRNRRFGGL